MISREWTENPCVASSTPLLPLKWATLKISIVSTRMNKPLGVLDYFTVKTSNNYLEVKP